MYIKIIIEVDDKSSFVDVEDDLMRVLEDNYDVKDISRVDY